MRSFVRIFIEQHSRFGIIIVVVVRLCPFRPWLTFIFGTKMTYVTLDTFHLYEKTSYDVNIASKDGNIHMVPLCRI